jgi:hypothetical protein
LGDGGADLAEGWGGDEYALVDLPDGSQGLAWATVWDDVAARDRFVAALTDHLDGFPLDASLEPLDVDGRPGALLRVGLPSTVTVRVRRAS